MHCGSPDPFWSSFSRPFIFVPASFLNEHDSKLGYHLNPGEDAFRKSENLSNSTTLDSSLSLAYQSRHTNDSRKDDSLAPSAAKTASRRRRRKARLADTIGVQRAEDIPEYKGQMSVDDLVKFINSGTLKDSVKTKPKKYAMNNNSKKHENGSFETCLKHEVNGRKLSGEIEVEECDQEPEKSNSTIPKGVNPEEYHSDMDPEGNNNTANDFIIVSRKKKGRQHLTRENSLNAMQLTPQAHQRPLQLESTRKPKGINEQSKALTCENRSSVSKVPASSDQSAASNQSRAEQNRSKNSSLPKSCISTENPSHDLEIKSKCKTHQMKGQAHPSGVSMESKVQSLYTKVTSCGNWKRMSPAAKSRYLRPPVVFTDGHHKKSENTVGISFGFDAQEAESGPESADDSGITPADTSAPNDFGHFKEKLHNAKSQAVVPLTSECSDENNCYELMRNTTLRSGTYSDSEVKEEVVSGVTLLKNAKSHQNNSISRNAKVAKHNIDAAKEQNIATMGTIRNTGCVKDNLSGIVKPDILSSEKAEVHPVNCNTSSKNPINCTAPSKNLIVSAKTKNSVQVTNLGVISADLSPCATSLSSTGRPISVVAPNQLLKTLCSSGQSLCSSSKSSSDHRESSSSNSHASLGQSEGSSIGPSFISSVGQGSHSGSCHGSTTILGPCARAPVVKVAPMLVEKLVFNQVTDVLCCTNDAAKNKSDSQHEESTVLEDDQKTACTTLPQPKEVKELSLATEEWETKHEPRTQEHEYEAAIKQEPFSHKHNCDVLKQELLLHRQDCNIVKEEACLNRQPCLPETKSDRTGPEDVQMKTKLHLPESNFDLLSAQIYLYKSYLDCLSDQHEFYTEGAATDLDPS